MLILSKIWDRRDYLEFDIFISSKTFFQSENFGRVADLFGVFEKLV